MGKFIELTCDGEKFLVNTSFISVVADSTIVVDHRNNTKVSIKIKVDETYDEIKRLINNKKEGN